MLMRTANSRTKTSWWATLGFLSIVLLLFAGIAQVAHTHADGQLEHRDCALCQSAHVSFASATAGPSVVPLYVLTARVASAQPHRRHHVKEVSLFNRPPPHLTTIA